MVKLPRCSLILFRSTSFHTISRDNAKCHSSDPPRSVSLPNAQNFLRSHYGSMILIGNEVYEWMMTSCTFWNPGIFHVSSRSVGLIESVGSLGQGIPLLVMWTEVTRSLSTLGSSSYSWRPTCAQAYEIGTEAGTAPAS